VKISDKRNQTILESRIIKEPVTISDCENCKIVNCDFSSNEREKAMLHLSDCRDVQSQNASFMTKTQ
jgi:hypothetical protein